ncbi:class I SAM-dependent methyltransferase [Vibrio breoganii]
MNYYNNNARAFYDGTIDVEMDSLYEEFLPHLKLGSFILDAGCGSGRDALAFKALGFKVHAIDASNELALLAESLIEQPVEVTTFQKFQSKSSFDGIWACASLLHVPLAELPIAFNNLACNLKTKGPFYCSFKYGNDEVERDGRNFTNLNETLLEVVLQDSPLRILKTWQTPDLRQEREDEKWLNTILIKEK